MLKCEISSRIFHFIQPAGTSRGVYTTRRSWFVRVTDSALPGAEGVGECAPLPKLSCDDIEGYESRLRELCFLTEQTGNIPYDAMTPYPSMLFGLETALMRLKSQSDIIFDTPFVHGEGITINGLVWMGNHDEMLKRMEDKVEKGFGCVKLKIGAIDFESELDLIKRLRRRFSTDTIQLRLDANGAFTPEEALEKLERLSAFGIHSIEQPIAQRQWDKMGMICRKSPIPIALDEELIGVNINGAKRQLLETIRPQYIILKPSLHGGICGCKEWIGMADEMGIGSWITSALESNVGLSAIAQFAAYMYGCPTAMPQGLGTGMLFADNVDMPLCVAGDKLYYKPTDE